VNDKAFRSCPNIVEGIAGDEGHRGSGLDVQHLYSPGRNDFGGVDDIVVRARFADDSDLHVGGDSSQRSEVGITMSRKTQCSESARHGCAGNVPHSAQQA
jgi:hypothetical protein